VQERYRHIWFYHPRARPPSPVSVQSLLDASASFGAEARLELSFVDGTPEPLQSSPAWLAERLGQHKVQLLTLASSTYAVNLWVRRDFGGVYAMLFMDVKRPELSSPEALARYFPLVAAAHGAPIAMLFTEDLKYLSSFGMLDISFEPRLSDEEILEAETTPEVAHALPPALALRLTSRIHVDGYDRGEIPEAVGWMNLWGPEVVERVGREKILAQPWDRVAELANGSLLLVVSADPPDRNRLDLLERVARVREGLELEALKRRQASSRG
jgi:hypothetical protein